MTETMLEVAVAQLSAIPPGEGRTFGVGGKQLAVFHTRSGEVFATQAICPHKAGPLADGLVGGTTLICPLHSWKFDLRSGAPLVESCGIETYAVRLDEEKRLWVTLHSNRE